jgi:hypothetical protein
MAVMPLAVRIFKKKNGGLSLPLKNKCVNIFVFFEKQQNHLQFDFNCEYPVFPLSQL